ncbi:N6-adenosine-methyltransferase 70 kDa subunit-like protein [Sarcoptes scabiei]|nr:N6-adenosine-methyltransferase 70 kDa subunit-like protein [Sarcoptes scabiei]
MQKWKRNYEDILSTSASKSTSFNLIQESCDDLKTDFKKIENRIIEILCDSSLNFPMDLMTIISMTSNFTDRQTIEDILIKLSLRKLIELNEYLPTTDGEKTLFVLSVDYDALKLVKKRNESNQLSLSDSNESSASNNILKRSLEDREKNISDDIPNADCSTSKFEKEKSENIADVDENDAEEYELDYSIINRTKKSRFNGPDSSKLDTEEKYSVEDILSLQSIKEKEDKKKSEEVYRLLSKHTAKELSLFEQFRSPCDKVQEFCARGTREECMRFHQSDKPCSKLHFLKIIQKHTDESLGNCSFLNTCFHMDSCKYVHYRVETKSIPNKSSSSKNSLENVADSLNQYHHHHLNISNNDFDKSEDSIPNDNQIVGNNIVKTLANATEQPFKRVLFPPQWIRCDLRFFDMRILGKFAVVMADPPWDIHMELPYGTMSDDEMRNLNIPCLQDEGLIFLWVTGRAMELGRECLKLWGYERCDELIWVKTNQLQRIIRTGRTGHWINHGKEHCLVGVKGNPKNLNRNLDCDVIVAEVRATSHKPDEIYGIIERLSPGTRKIELFGRQHNTQPNWVTLGNQLDCVRLVDPQLIEAYKKAYPEEEFSTILTINNEGS